MGEPGVEQAADSRRRAAHLDASVRISVGVAAQPVHQLQGLPLTDRKHAEQHSDVDLAHRFRRVGCAHVRTSITNFWQHLVNRSVELRAAIEDREARLKDMNWAERNLPEFAGGRGAAAERILKALRLGYMSTMESELEIMKDFDALIHSARDTLTVLENPKPLANSAPTFVYWRDDMGEHSFYTKELGVD